LLDLTKPKLTTVFDRYNYVFLCMTLSHNESYRLVIPGQYLRVIKINIFIFFFFLVYYEPFRCITTQKSITILSFTVSTEFFTLKNLRNFTLYTHCCLEWLRFALNLIATLLFLFIITSYHTCAQLILLYSLL